MLTAVMDKYLMNNVIATKDFSELFIIDACSVEVFVGRGSHFPTSFDCVLAEGDTSH